jgi:hypothetical protein
MRRVKHAKLSQSLVRILQETCRCHGVGSNHQAIGEVHMRLTVFAFDQKVGYRISVISEAFK